MLKQVIIVRKDLHMRMGKVASQCAHASMKCLLDLNYAPKNFRSNVLWNDEVSFKINIIDEWLINLFTKIVVYVNSEKELLDIYNKAKHEKMICALIEDSGLTEFNGVKTLTCCAIGPDYNEKINEITGHLPLL